MLKWREEDIDMSKARWIIGVSLLVLAVVFISGCIFTFYTVTSEPSGAEVVVDGEFVGYTPQKFYLSDPVVKVTMVIKKEGYKEVQQPLKSGPSTVYHFRLEEDIPPAPVTFVRTLEPSWASIEIVEHMEYEKVWSSVVDLLARKFDLEVLSKENGYLRTNWLYSWTGELREDYRVRVTIKFSQDRSKVDVKSEANYRTRTGWVIGSDTALLQTLKTDIMGTVGRVTR